MKDKCHMSDEEWKKKLDKVQFAVTRKKCTEKPFTGKYWDAKDQGVYRCVCCGQDLFASSAKFDSGCGWPSFCEPVDKEAQDEPDQGDTQEIEPAGLAMPEDVDLADWIEPEDLDQTRD